MLERVIRLQIPVSSHVAGSVVLLSGSSPDLYSVLLLQERLINGYYTPEISEREVRKDSQCQKDSAAAAAADSTRGVYGGG